MIVLGAAVAFLAVACGVWLWLHHTTKDESPFRDIPFDHARHIRLLEHELMIAGHEKDCPPCLKTKEEANHQRELEIVRAIAREEYDDIDVRKVMRDLKAARPEYEMVEVTGLGSTKAHYLRGRKL